MATPHPGQQATHCQTHQRGTVTDVHADDACSVLWEGAAAPQKYAAGAQGKLLILSAPPSVAAAAKALRLAVPAKTTGTIKKKTPAKPKGKAAKKKTAKPKGKATKKTPAKKTASSKTSVAQTALEKARGDFAKMIAELEARTKRINDLEKRVADLRKAIAVAEKDLEEPLKASLGETEKVAEPE